MKYCIVLFIPSQTLLQFAYLTMTCFITLRQGLVILNAVKNLYWTSRFFPAFRMTNNFQLPTKD